MEINANFLTSAYLATICTQINSRGGGGSSSHLLEYVATFPNVTVNAGDEYKACVLTTKDLSSDGLICNTGQNSPANRPEFVDMSLNATGTNLALNTAQMLLSCFKITYEVTSYNRDIFSNCSLCKHIKDHIVIGKCESSVRQFMMCQQYDRRD